MKENQELFCQIGERIKKSRKAVGLTQEKLADRIDVSSQYVSDLERGVVGTSVPTLVNICETLHVSCDYILMGRESVPIAASDSKDSSDPDIYKSIQFLSSSEKDIVERGVQLLIEAFSNNSK